MRSNKLWIFQLLIWQRTKSTQFQSPKVTRVVGASMHADCIVSLFFSSSFTNIPNSSMQHAILKINLSTGNTDVVVFSILDFQSLHDIRRPPVKLLGFVYFETHPRPCMGDNCTMAATTRRSNRHTYYYVLSLCGPLFSPWTVSNYRCSRIRYESRFNGTQSFCRNLKHNWGRVLLLVPGR